MSNYTNQEMTEKEWQVFGEIQYLKGRLDELFKLNSTLSSLDMHDFRIIDARISKLLDKLKSVDGMAYQLYHVEKENIKHSIQRSIRDERNKKSREAS
jgi:hypothetical protein